MSGSGNKPPLSCTPGGPPPAGNFGLHGRPIDVFTDPGGNRHALLFVRARHYDLTNGRWLQRDPKGYVDGPNLYEAFGGNPLSHVDPDGTRYKLASGWANGDELVWQDYGYFTGVTADFSVGRYYCLGGEKFVTYSSPFIDDPNPNVDFYVLPLAVVEQWGQGQLSQGLYNHWVGLFGIPYHRDDDGNVQRIERDPWEAGVTVIGQLTEQNRMAIRRIYNWCTTGPGDRVLTMVTRGADPVTGQNVTEKDAKEVVANITWYVAQAWLAGRLAGPGVVQSPSAAPQGAQQTVGATSLRARVMANIGESRAARAVSNIDVLFAKEAQLRGGYAMDSWHMRLLPKGSIVYGGIPGQSPFYTDAATVIASGGSRATLFQSLQVGFNIRRGGYRPAVSMYLANEDIRVPAGKALEKPGLGIGEGNQFFIRNYTRYLEEMGFLPLGQ